MPRRATPYGFRSAASGTAKAIARMLVDAGADTARAGEPRSRPLERAPALAYLRAPGAILCADPNVWLETLALVSSYGMPAGPRVLTGRRDTTQAQLAIAVPATTSRVLSESSRTRYR